LGGCCAPGKKERRGRTEKLTGGDRLPDREKGGGAAWAGAEGAGLGWLLGRGEKRGEGKEEVGRRWKKMGPRKRKKGGKGLGRGLGELGCQLGCSSLFLFFFSFLFQNNSIQFEFKWDLNSNLTIQTNKRDAPAWMHKHVDPKVSFNYLWIKLV
jgi:hypothetical protein